MIQRLSYLARRIREAGPRQVAAKLWQKANPYARWPLYAGGEWPRTGSQERTALREFGNACAQAFRVAGGADPARAHRARERLGLAQAPDFSVLGYGYIPKPSGAAWHADPLHGHAWKPRYFARCDFVALHVRADVKIPWELSRLQWLLWLAEAALDSEPAEQEAIKAQMLFTMKDWAAANPAGYGVNWACGMEVAIRAANLAVAAGTIAHLLNDAEVDWIAAILAAHRDYLARFPENSDVPGNHYLTDLMGEVVIHAALDGLGSAAFAKATAQFASAAEAQFESGGCHIERATIYHRLTFDIVALPHALALAAGDASVARLAGVVARAAAFMAQICDDSGTLPVFGDQDSGHVLWFGESAQAVDARNCMAPNAVESDLYSFLGALARNDSFFPRVAREAGRRSGFATITGGGFRATMKTGPIGLQGRAAHDHDDALSVCASFAGRALIIDPGCHSYTLDPMLRREFLLSSRHNTPVPAQRERHEPSAGSINATMRGAPTAECIAWSSGAAQGRMASTAALGMTVTRDIRTGAGKLEILDHWQFKQGDAARIAWLFDPAWELLAAEPRRNCANKEKTLMLRSTWASLVAHIEVPEGSIIACTKERYSPNYGALRGCWAVHITTSVALEGRVKLRLSEQQ